MENKIWLEKRRKCITATDIGAIVGLSPYRSAFDVWYAKTSDTIAESETNEAMTWGNRLEPIIAQAYTDLYKINLKKAEFICRDIDGVPCGCTPDYCSEKGNINIEIKTAKWNNNWGEAGTDEVPDYYLTQCTWQMGITGQRMTHLACLIGASDFRVYNIPFSQSFFDDLLSRAKKFWELVMAKTPPTTDGSVSCRIYYSQLYKSGSKALVENPSKALHFNAARYFKLARLTKLFEILKEEMANKIIAEVGDFSGVKIPGLGKVTVIKGGKEREQIGYKDVVEELKPHIPIEIFNSIITANTKKSISVSQIRTYPEKE